MNHLREITVHSTSKYAMKTSNLDHQIPRSNLSLILGIQQQRGPRNRLLHGKLLWLLFLHCYHFCFSDSEFIAGNSVEHTQLRAWFDFIKIGTIIFYENYHFHWSLIISTHTKLVEHHLGVLIPFKPARSMLMPENTENFFFESIKLNPINIIICEILL